MSAAGAPTVSAIVPARDAAHHLQRTLPALTASLPAGAEVLVIDDGSRDDTAMVARASGACVLRQDSPRGPAAARNRGAREARGELLLFLDADCLPHPDTVGRLVAAFDEPAVAAAFGSYDDRPEAGTLVSLYKNLAHHFVHQRSPPEATTFWAGCGAVRRDAFLKLNGFDESYSRPSIEDVELGYRLVAAGHRIRLVKDAQVTHLKRWTLRSWVIADLRDRALPWACLLRAGRPLPRGLNFTRIDRLASALVAGAAMAVGYFVLTQRKEALVAAAGALMVALLLDASFLAFAARRVSPAFALAAGALQLLHRALGLVGLLAGLLMPKKPEPGPPTST